MIEDTIDITIEITDICRRYNLLPDVDNQTLGERRESIENFEDSVIDDLNKVLIPKEDGGVLAGTGRVDYAFGPAPGVFSIVKSRKPNCN